MRAATNAILAVVATAASLSACDKTSPDPEQNITIDNGIDPNADIEAVPADEGGEEPVEEQANAPSN